jgi:hypothetical protein
MSSTRKSTRFAEKSDNPNPRRLDFDKESAHVNAKLAEIINSALECGYKIAYDLDHGFEIVPDPPAIDTPVPAQAESEVCTAMPPSVGAPVTRPQRRRSDVLITGMSHGAQPARHRSPPNW